MVMTSFSTNLQVFERRRCKSRTTPRMFSTQVNLKSLVASGTVPVPEKRVGLRKEVSDALCSDIGYGGMVLKAEQCRSSLVRFWAQYL